MKKLSKKLTVFFSAGILAAALLFTLAACGEQPAPEKQPAKITAVYASNELSFFSAYPNFTYKQLTVSAQSVTLYDDGTYCFSQVDNMISGALNFPDVATDDNAVSYVNRGSSVTNYYGKFTSTDEEGILTVSLQKPTAVRYTSKINQQGYVNGYFDSDNWTDDMATLMGTKGEDGSVTKMTKEAFLAKYAFNPLELTVDTAAGGFEFAHLTVGA